MSHPLRVSVVVPVYNAASFLPGFFSSFLKQTIPDSSVEIIFVDDGSTDGGDAFLDEIERKHGNVRVVHQENSGWPGQPRNLGVSMARGDFVFFADPDDELGGPEALQRLVNFAEANNSDVVVPKMITRGDREYTLRPYSSTQTDADLVACFATLTPQKLIRRSFLVDREIRFPEQATSLEDGQFMSEVYSRANRVSILTGYDFYVLIHHEGQDHLSFRPKDPTEYVGALTIMCSNVERYCADVDIADRVINDLYYRKVLLNFKQSRLLKQSPELRQRWLTSQRSFVNRFIGERRYKLMHSIARTRTDLVREGNIDEIVQYVLADSVRFVLDSASSQRGQILLKGAFKGEANGGALPELIVAERGNSEAGVILQFSGTFANAYVKVPRSALPRTSDKRIHDLWLTAGPGYPKRRIYSPVGHLTCKFTDDREVTLYSTKNGKLSIEIGPGLSLRNRLKRRLGRYLTN